MPFNSVGAELKGFFLHVLIKLCTEVIRIHNNNLRFIIIINDMISLNLNLYKKKALAITANASFILNLSTTYILILV